MGNVHRAEADMMRKLEERNPKDPFLTQKRDRAPVGGVRAKSTEAEKWDLTQTSEFNRDGLLSRETRASGDFPLIIDRVKTMAAFYNNEDLLRLAERTQPGRIDINVLRRDAHRFLTQKLQNEKSA